MAAEQKRKIQWAISLFLVMLYFSGLPAQAKYGGGTGEPNDPYLIYTAEQMNAIGAEPNDWDKHFKLMADIDLSSYTGTDFNIIGYSVDLWSPDNKPFTGVFDGSGNTISNFSYASTDANGIGLFGYVDDPNAVIKDLGLIAPNVDAGTGRYVGSLVGYMKEGTITGCYAEGGSIAGDSGVGGLVGYNASWSDLGPGTISDCYATGSVSGIYYVGGLVGENRYSGTITCSHATSTVTGVNSAGGLVGNNHGTITNCYSSGDVSANGYVGGLVGDNSHYGGPITNCYATGSVSGSGTEWWQGGVGGLVGGNDDRITNCYATASVAGVDYVGGLIGVNAGFVSQCYSAGAVDGTSNVGGLLGSEWDPWCWDEGFCSREGFSSHCFWDIQTSGQPTSAGGTGLTTVEMQMASTFIGWGCGRVWTLDEGKDYPRLWWENKPGELLDTQLSDFLAGTGTQDDPYLIYTAEQLNMIGLFPCESSKHFKLMADIDLSGFTGTDFNIIGDRVSPFTGVFDGNGKIISNFSYTSTDRNYIGLFGYVGKWREKGEIKDLGLIDPNVDAGTGDRVGSLVGYLSEGTVTGCHVDGGSVSGNNHVGGLVGWNGSYYEAGGRITNCYSSGDVEGGNYVGGLVGCNSYSGTITNCYAIGSVSGDSIVGGLVGENNDTITNCYSTGSVIGDSSVGGLVGWNFYATITNCYSTSSVTGDNHVGGLVGQNYGDGTIINCYSTGSVTGTTNIGGLIGSKSEHGTPTVVDSFWDIQTSGQAASARGTGKTTAEMQTESTFTDAGWDFLAETVNGTEDIWWILEGQDYPRLWWELVGN